MDKVFWMHDEKWDRIDYLRAHMIIYEFQQYQRRNMNITMQGKYQREDGTPVKIICIDRKNHDGYCVVALVQQTPDSETVESWRIDGTREHSGFNLMPVPIKHEGWITVDDCEPWNISAQHMYDTPESVHRERATHVAHVTWES